MNDENDDLSAFLDQTPETHFHILKYLGLHNLRPLVLSSESAYNIVKKNYLFWHEKFKKNVSSPDNLLVKQTYLFILELKKKYLNYFFILKNVQEVRSEIDTDQIDITHLSRSGNKIFVSSDDQTVKLFEVNDFRQNEVNDSVCFYGNHIRKKQNIDERNFSEFNNADYSMNIFSERNYIFVGHQGGIWTFSNNDKYLVTGSTDKTIRIWSLENYICMHVLKGHKSTIRCLIIEDDYIISGSRDSEIRIWNFDGECLFVLKGHNESVRCIDTHNSQLISGSYDGTVILWDFKLGKKLKFLKRHLQRVYVVKINENYIISAGQCSDIYVSDRNGNLKFVLKEHRSVVVWLIVFKSFLISAGADGNIVKWNLKDGEKEYQIIERKHTTALKYYNGLLIVANNSAVNLYDVKSGNFIRNLLLNCQTVNCVVFDENGIVIGCRKNHKTKLVHISYKQINK
ncbi:E3 ubiquitin-protein ligase traf7 [Gurleya vavrai]